MVFRRGLTKSRKLPDVNVFQDTSSKAGGTFCGVLAKSRRPSGRNVFSGYISEGWRDFSLSIDPKPKAVWCKRFSGHISKGWRDFSRGIDQKSKAIWSQRFFRSTFPKAGEAFRRGSTKSRRLPGVALFRAIAVDRLGSLAIGGKRQPEADGRKHFSGVHLRMLAGLSAGD